MDQGLISEVEHDFAAIASNGQLNCCLKIGIMAFGE